MAVLCDIVIKGVNFKNVYVKVEDIGGSKMHHWAVIYAVYANKELSGDLSNKIDQFVIKFDFLNGKDIYTEAYNFLKKPDMMTDMQRLVKDLRQLSNYSILQTISNIRDA
jgi:hypothetical protein